MDDVASPWRLHRRAVAAEVAVAALLVVYVLSRGRIGFANEGNDLRGWLVGLVVLAVGFHASSSTLIVAILARSGMPRLAVLLAHVIGPGSVVLVLGTMFAWWA